MAATLSLQNWVEPFRFLTPISGLVHVGPSTGQAALYAEWGVQSVLLIDADEICRDKLAVASVGHPGWAAHAVLLSDREVELDFHVATNPDENGLIPPECLAGLWRNLKTKEQRRVTATSLASLLATSHTQSGRINWVLVDCLPALLIIRGAGQHINDWDVIIARVVLDESQLRVPDTTKAELDVYLSAYGYRCVAVEEERHPAIGRALYVRDWKILLHARLQRHERDAADQAEANIQLQQANEQQSRLAVELQRQVERLTIAKDEQINLAAERQTQLELVSGVKDEQFRLTDELQRQLELFTIVKDEQARLATEWQTQLAQVTVAKDEQMRLAFELQQQVLQLAIAKDEQTRLVTERQAQLEQVIASRDEHARLAVARQKEVEQLTIAKDEQTRLVTERQEQLELLIASRDEHAQLAVERLQQVARLTNANDEQIKLAEERRRQLADTQKRFQLFEVQHAELTSKQTPLLEEIIRAEAQIDLIKDLLFRESGL